MGKASGIKGKRLHGGSSPHKKSLYELHYLKLKAKIIKKLNKKKDMLNSIAKKKKKSYTFKIKKFKCKSGEHWGMERVKI